ncbi:hypothetical protein [Motilimonas eburnea]|uniref:hypothetical protein n=1 Tax=Motilimonas eburnea TaxID=1737488 RepID=UPI001E5FFFAB|nr:hypothetical protein [Motilimonas eburnea]MCE2573650.1 hypothetical protein [Motilimonas eburnea]
MKLACLPLLWFICSLSHAGEALELVLPASKDGSHEYYHEILVRSLAAQGIEVSIITPYSHIPQKRSVRLLQSEMLSLFWMIETPERDQQYTKVNVGLTNGLIGKRVLLVPKQDRRRYSQVKSLADFKALGVVGGFGANWFDIEVWQANDLAYVVRDGEWRALYGMLSTTGGINYFSRGINEIIAEQRQYPYLAIEPHLLLVYQRDFVFYLNKQTAHLKPILESALQKAKASGLMEQIITEYWGEHFRQLNLQNRLTLKLITP